MTCPGKSCDLVYTFSNMFCLLFSPRLHPSDLNEQNVHFKSAVTTCWLLHSKQHGLDLGFKSFVQTSVLIIVYKYPPLVLGTLNEVS